MNIHWKFILKEPMASLTQVLLQENINFWSEKLRFLFYGYQTVKAKKAVIWGKKVPLSIQIAPHTSAIVKQPLVAIQPQPPRSALSPGKQVLMDELQKKIETLRASVPPPLADERIYYHYVDGAIFTAAYQQMAKAWDNPEIELHEKLPLVTPFLLILYDAVKDMKLPAELMRDDTMFCLKLVKILQYVEIIKENANIHRLALPSEVEKLQVLLDQLTDAMIEGGHKIFGFPLVVDEALQQKYLENKITAVHSSGLSIDSRLEMLEKLRQNPCADIQDQIELLEESIKIIWKEVEQKAKRPACPHKKLIETHLEGIRLYLKEFEEEGEKIWQIRMAEEMLDSANSWRESESGTMPMLSQEDFAQLIFLASLNIETTEMEDGIISYKTELFFKDKDDSFDGHTMYAKVVNKEVIEITLMG